MRVSHISMNVYLVYQWTAAMHLVIVLNINIIPLFCKVIHHNVIGPIFNIWLCFVTRSMTLADEIERLIFVAEDNDEDGAGDVAIGVGGGMKVINPIGDIMDEIGI